MKNAAQRLVTIIKRIEKLTMHEEQLRNMLLTTMKDNESVTVGEYTVTKKLKKQTIVDPDKLIKLGFDISKVTVVIHKINPTLVKTIGVAENKPYFHEVPSIIVTKNP